MIKFTVNGILYSGLKLASEAAGISRMSLCVLIKSNKLPPNIVIVSKYKNGSAPIESKLASGKSIMINGVVYSSITKASKDLDVSIQLLYAKSKNKQPDDDILIDLDLVKRKRLKYGLVINGVRYNSLMDAAGKTGLSLHTLSTIYNKQIANNEASVYRPPSPNVAKQCTANGVSYPSIRDAVVASGKSSYSISSEMKLKLDKRPLMRITNGVTVKGVTYESIYDAMDKLGLSRGHVYRLSAKEKKK